MCVIGEGRCFFLRVETALVAINLVVSLLCWITSVTFSCRRMVELLHYGKGLESTTKTPVTYESESTGDCMKDLQHLSYALTQDYLYQVGLYAVYGLIDFFAAVLIAKSDFQNDVKACRKAKTREERRKRRYFHYWAGIQFSSTLVFLAHQIFTLSAKVQEISEAGLIVALISWKLSFFLFFAIKLYRMERNGDEKNQELQDKETRERTQEEMMTTEKIVLDEFRKSKISLNDESTTTKSPEKGPVEKDQNQNQNQNGSGSSTSKYKSAPQNNTRLIPAAAPVAPTTTTFQTNTPPPPKEFRAPSPHLPNPILISHESGFHKEDFLVHNSLQTKNSQFPLKKTAKNDEPAPGTRAVSVAVVEKKEIQNVIYTQVVPLTKTKKEKNNPVADQGNGTSAVFTPPANTCDPQFGEIQGNRTDLDHDHDHGPRSPLTESQTESPLESIPEGDNENENEKPSGQEAPEARVYNEDEDVVEKRNLLKMPSYQSLPETLKAEVGQLNENQAENEIGTETSISGSYHSQDPAQIKGHYEPFQQPSMIEVEPKIENDQLTAPPY